MEWLWADRSDHELTEGPRAHARAKLQRVAMLVAPPSSVRAMTAHLHRYEARCSWQGSTAAGYDAYDRTLQASCLPAGSFALSADTAFGGSPELMNPEQLLLLAASSCQLLSFLAVAARSRIDVVAYEDVGEALMPDDQRPIRITEIHLHPTITVRPPASEARVARMVEVAHRECFIANSVTCAITVIPTVQVRPADGP